MPQTPDILEIVLQLVTTFPFNVIIIVGVVGYILYFIWSSVKKEEEEFKIEDFRDSVFQFVEKLMDTFGIASDSYLVRGIELQGKVTKWYPVKIEMPDYRVDTKDKKLVIVKKKKGKVKEFDAIIFQIGSKGFFSFILGSKPKFVILERKTLTFDSDSKKWAMDESTSLIPYANVFIASTKTEQWINNISFMRSQEEVLTYAQNFARKTAWLELAHVKIMDYVLGREDKKRAGWEGFRRKALGYDVDDDEERD